MKRLVAATKNKGKLKEISEILKELPYEVISMEEMGITEDIEENGNTFEENALIKAESISKVTGDAVMADDSGLEVDYLNGAPGIFSARYAGEGASDKDRYNKLLDELKEIPFEKRTARFVCAVAVVFPDGRKFTVRGTLEGKITLEAKGQNGFGYDPIFLIPELGLTAAELDSNVKNRISHRGKALELMVEKLKSI